jgi:hypothetical protein
MVQVELYAEYQPDQLLPFLQSSKQFNKEAALQVCRERQLVREQVFILGRLSRASEALQLIIGTLHDLPQAIAFVSNHGELWDELLQEVVKDPELTGELLDQVWLCSVAFSCVLSTAPDMCSRCCCSGSETVWQPCGLLWVHC